MRREQLDLGTTRDEVLYRVENLGDMAAVGGDDTRTDSGPAMKIEMVGLGHGHLVTAPDLGDDRPDGGTFFLERMDVSEQDVELNPADPHMTSVAGTLDNGGHIARND